MTNVSTFSTPLALSPCSMKSSPISEQQVPAFGSSSCLSTFNLNSLFEDSSKVDSAGLLEQNERPYPSPLFGPKPSGANHLDLMASPTPQSLPDMTQMNGRDNYRQENGPYQIHQFTDNAALELDPSVLAHELMLLPSSNGFVVTIRNQAQSNDTDAPIQHVPVSWDTFFSFVMTPSNTSHLSISHPIRILPRSLQGHSIEETRPLSSPAYTTGGHPSPLMAWPSSVDMHGFAPQGMMMSHLTSEADLPQTVAPSNMARRISDPEAVPRFAALPHLTTLNTSNHGSPAMFSTPTPTFPPPLSAPDGGLLNAQDDHYVFSQSQGRLLRLGTKEGDPEALLPENTLITFKAGTVREAKERDGARAIPAWTPAWPGSNEWLKAQYCAPTCLYERGFGNKRPVLIREHLRKCPLLSEDHPLKVLARLELDAHARAQWLATSQRALKRKREEEGLTLH